MRSSLPPRSRILKYAVCYGTAYFSTISMKTLYSTFLVSIALQGYKLPLEWFYFGQAVLGAWNAVDDSLAAWFASWLHRGETEGLRHVNAYLFGAPFLVTAFVIPFFPWSLTNPTIQGLHYVFAICFWDAAMSYVGVSHSALGTDISGHLIVRTRCKKMEIVALTATSFLIGGATMIYDSHDLTNFRRYVMANALVSFTLLLTVHRVLKSEMLQELAEAKAEARSAAYKKTDEVETSGGPTTNGDLTAEAAPQNDDAEEVCLDDEDRLRTEDDSVLTKIKQTALNGNFRCWIIMQFCVYCNTIFQTKFYHLFSQALFQGSRLDGFQGPMLSTAHVVRSILSVFYVLPAVEVYGIFPIFRLGMLVQMAVALLGGIIAFYFRMLLPYVFMLNVIACSHKVIVGMFIADLTDEDLVKHRRPHSQSSFFFSIRSLFTVWGDSAVPMTVVWCMTRAGINPSNDMAEEGVGKQDVLIAFWWGVPLGFALVKLLVSSFFTLKGDYLQQVKARRQRLMQRAMRDKIK